MSAARPAVDPLADTWPVPRPSPKAGRRGACPIKPPSGRLLARIKYVEAVAARPLIVTGDNAIAYGVSLALGFSPSLPSGGLRRKWPNPLRALLGETKAILWVNTHLTA